MSVDRQHEESDAQHDRDAGHWRQLAERFRLLFEHAPDGLTLLDPHHPSVSWPIVACNPAFARMNGFTREELVGQSIDIIHGEPEDPDRRAAYLATLRMKKSFSLEVEHRRKDGSTFTIETSTTLVEINGREYVIGVDRDITDKKETEQAIQHYTQELEARNQELDAFAYTIAHDLRSPLSTILSYINLANSDEEEDPEQAAMIMGTIETVAQRMLSMVDDMLLFASLRDVKEIREPVDTLAVCHAALERLRPRIAEKQIDLRMPSELPPVVAYGPWLEEVFANLLDNAVKYIGEDNPAPRIEVSGQATGEGMVTLTVRDNGVGIRVKDQARVFETFTRYHQMAAPGSGLGLSIVGRIIQRFGGEIDVESTPGEGTSFWFTLPAA